MTETLVLKAFILFPKPGTTHWAKLHKLKKLYAAEFLWQARAQKYELPLNNEITRVHIIRHHQGAQMDADNLAATAKVPLDALTRAGLIVDDSPQHIDFNISEQLYPKIKGWTEIRLTNMSTT